MSDQLSFFDATKETWLRLARMEARRIANEKGKVSADDLHKALPTPKYIDGRIMGSVFKGMRCIGMKKSERKKCHHRLIGEFVLE
jgi:hypothetical protein